MRDRALNGRSALDRVNDAEWNTLASRRIFFGHQSVGRDIVDGMRRLLRANPHINVRIVTADDPTVVGGPALVEALIGRNCEPLTKMRAFERILDSGFGREPGAIGLCKFCYVDVLPDTDPDALFDSYARSIDSIRNRHPGLTIAHVTVPLRHAQNGFRERLKMSLGRPTQTTLNHARNRFNDRLRARYGDRDSVFDLAAIESTRSDGSRTYTRYRGRDVHMLAPEYTHDGGHLNEDAQDHIAGLFLEFLARLAIRAVGEARSA